MINIINMTRWRVRIVESLLCRILVLMIYVLGESFNAILMSLVEDDERFLVD
jgi:hypothetical protein